MLDAFDVMLYSMVVAALIQDPQLHLSLPGAGIPDTATVAGRDLMTGLLRRAVVDAQAVRAALERPIAQIVTAVTELLEQAPPELSADLTQRGLMLVGGGALLPGFGRLLESETGLTVTVDPEPLTTVARGAGEALDEINHFEFAPKRSRRR